MSKSCTRRAQACRFSFSRPYKPDLQFWLCRAGFLLGVINVLDNFLGGGGMVFCASELHPWSLPIALLQL